MAEENQNQIINNNDNGGNNTKAASDDSESIIEHHPVVIVGGGIGGLVLALSLDQVYNHPTDHTEGDDSAGDDDGTPPRDKKCKLPIHVYESTSAYRADAGGAIGLYSNGLRVLRHISETHPNAKVSSVLEDVRSAGCDYLYRRWMRHDGTEVAVAREDELLPDVGMENDDGGGNGTSGSTANSSSGSHQQQQQQEQHNLRPRGDSMSSQDKEGERADMRPRGGSFRKMRGSFLKFGLGGGGAPLAPDGNGTDHQSRPSRGSFAGLAAEALPSLAVSGSNEPDMTMTRRRSSNVETELLSLGIRRWKYQQVLYEACVSAGIEIHFGKRLQSVSSVPSSSSSSSSSTGGGEDDCRTMLHFKDGSRVTTSLLIGADGINSKVRNYVTNPQNEPMEDYVPEYTGVTCLMGCANVPRIRGICFPSSATTKCHACYYPTRAPREGTDDDPSDYEQVFQIYFPSPIERTDTWRTLTPQEAKEECSELAAKLRGDGWDEQFLKPLESPTLTGVLRVGLRSREGLESWHVGGDCSSNGEESDSRCKENVGRAVLLGDAAHPPVPYIGQGAMMAMEDAGTLSMLLGHYCPIAKHNHDGGAMATPDFTQFTKAMAAYEQLRVSRTKAILGSSVQLGKTQQKRAESMLYNAWREMSIKAQVWAYGTLPVMRPGAAFDYRKVVEEALAAENELAGNNESG